MKILLYSDLHISKTSSILPLNFSDASKYSYRQHMIVEVGKYLAELAEKYKPDLIINLGDTFDQHTVTSYDIDTASEFFSCFNGLNIPHFVLVGNHEMINSTFNALALLNNVDNIRVIKDPTSISLYTNDTLAFLPYCDYSSIVDFPEGKYLFCHQDINGSSIRGNIVMSEGISPDVLRNNYKLVFNGHIHKPSMFGNIVNVGSVTTHSFADDELSVPQCYIFNTNTMDLTTYKPTICPLFRKLDVSDKYDLCNQLDALDKNYKYIINCSCPFDYKEDVKTVLSTYSSVINHKINVKVDKNKTTEEEKAELVMQQSNLDITKSFIEFLDTIDLKYPKGKYVDIMQEVKSNNG